MKKLKMILSLALMLGFTITGFSQNQKFISKGEEKAAEINELIMSVDSGLALNAEQVKTIVEMFAQKLVDIKALRKQNLPSEELEAKIKELHQGTAKKINKDILTKQQFKAFREGKKQAAG